MVRPAVKTDATSVPEQATVKRCIAVVVTYLTEAETLCATIGTLAPQVQGVVVVDNSPMDRAGAIRALLEGMLSDYAGSFDFVANGANLGIAAAQNMGIKRALALGAEYVVFSDHDTCFPADAVATLVARFGQKVAAGEKVGAVGPAFINTHAAGVRPYFMRQEGFFAQKVRPEGATVEVSYLIASGLVASAAALRDVGGFRAGFFIDWVDIEWCLRAKSKGYRIFGCGEVCLLHRLGDRSVPFLGRTVTLHNPFRHYHKTRNAIWLARLDHAGTPGMRLNFVCLALAYAVVFPFLAKPHRAHFTACWRGVLHGFGRMDRT